MAVMRYVECQHQVCMKPCLMYGRLSFLSHFLLPFRFPSLLSLQGDEPLNSDDDDEDSDGEGTHFDTEDNIVCQFEKVH